MTFPSLGLWQTGTASQKLLRMAQGGYLGRPVALFGGGINPTTAGGSHGVVSDGDLNVTIGSGLQLNVSTGQCFINGTSSIDQGTYYGYNPTTQSVTLDAHQANPRIDLIVVRARDNAEDASGFTDFICTFKKGTAAGSPVAPTPDAGSLVIAQVTVPATSGAVTIDTSVKPYATAIGGIVRCRSTLRPTGAALRIGTLIYELDTQRIWKYNGSAWLPVSGRFGARVSASQLIATATVSTITFAAENEDSDGMSSLPSQSIVVPTGLGGVWSLFAYVLWSASATGTIAVIEIMVNGSPLAHSDGQAFSAYNSTSGMYPLAAGTTIGARVYQNSGGSLTATVELAAYRMGD